jgi:pectinesterase
LLDVPTKSQGCTLHAVATSYGAIAASQRSSPKEDSGFSFVGCRLTGSGMLYLGRAWGRYARVVYSYCDLSGIVVPQGWSDWGDRTRTK